MQVDLDNTFMLSSSHTLSPPIDIVPTKKPMSFKFISSVNSSKKTTPASSSCSTPLQFSLEIEPSEPVEKPIEVKNLLTIPKNLLSIPPPITPR